MSLIICTMSFDLLRIDDLGGQVVVDLGVGEEALLLAAPISSLSCDWRSSGVLTGRADLDAVAAPFAPLDALPAWRRASDGLGRTPGRRLVCNLGRRYRLGRNRLLRGRHRPGGRDRLGVCAVLAVRGLGRCLPLCRTSSRLCDLAGAGFGAALTFTGRDFCAIAPGVRRGVELHDRMVF